MRQAAARLIRSLLLLTVAVTATVVGIEACAGRTAEAAVRLPEVRAHADYLPDDPGTTKLPGGWANLQWNFTGSYGVGAPSAWDNLIAAGLPGGAGVIVAVVDTGVAYMNRAPYRRSPDLSATRFVPGYDFVSRDRYPLDLHGHGTHVASTIAEEANNRYGLTGLAYGTRIMPVRVLNRSGAGTATGVANGIRFAVDHGAKVINLSLSFVSSTTSRQIPQVIQALQYAEAKGRLVVASAGNSGHPALPYPARWASVLSVGASTELGCAASFSNFGDGLDIVAPGGGGDAYVPDDPHCHPGWRGRSIFQITFRPPSVTNFGIRGFMGTSMAAPHVSATAALVVASGVLGPDPSPAAITERLAQTARDLGVAGYDARYGWGLVNAAAATTPVPPPPAPAPPPAQAFDLG